MARRYSIVGDQNAAATISILGLTSAATIRPTRYTVIMGSAAAPADQANNMQLKRYTAAGTATSFTPHGLNPSDPAALASAAMRSASAALVARSAAAIRSLSAFASAVSFTSAARRFSTLTRAA